MIRPALQKYHHFESVCVCVCVCVCKLKFICKVHAYQILLLNINIIIMVIYMNAVKASFSQIKLIILAEYVCFLFKK